MHTTLILFRLDTAVADAVTACSPLSRTVVVRQPGELEVLTRQGPCVGVCQPASAGIDVVREALRQSSGMPWLAVIDTMALADCAVRDVILGYCIDYFRRPLLTDRLREALGHAAGMALLHPLVARDPHPRGELLGQSEVMAQVRTQVEACARSAAPVLITGESGTGKELVARAVHNQSPRGKGPFVAINCGAVPDGLIQSELFGHKRGAFTGALQDREGKLEAARGGSVFLDEIGDLPKVLQVNLLRFLQEGVIEKIGAATPIPVDVRVIAATHVALAEAVRAGAFREDLWYRLNVLSITLPPLRERPEDIPLLADHYLERYRSEAPQGIWGYTHGAYAAMVRYPWPGNIRELINVVRRAIVLCRSRYIDTPLLGLTPGDKRSVLRPLSRVRADADRRAIEDCLRATNHNVSAASRLLNISRLSLYRLMEKYHLAPTRKQGSD